MKLSENQLYMLYRIVELELEYYDRKEDMYQEDKEYQKELKKIFDKIKKEIKKIENK